MRCPRAGWRSGRHQGRTVSGHDGCENVRGLPVGLKVPRKHASTACFERYSDFSFVIFVPSSVTPAINPLFVSTNASIGAIAVVVCTLPFAPTFKLHRLPPTSLR